jgi:hypothetical protein
MPVDYQIDAGRRLIRTRCIGPLGFEEVIAHFRQLAADPLVPEEPDVLLDFSELTTFPDRDQVYSVAREVRELRPRISWRNLAIVAPRDLAFGIARMFEMISEPSFRATRVFRSLADAERWIEKPDAAAPRPGGCDRG